ncbi:hypothetical protein C1J03_17385 [Sulfitobacter sp. SK012]|nr:hypothetical protein C1J03_17385 [Sulfitobacter sp. SK012]
MLKTNIFATPSTEMANMPTSTTDAFDLLLATFKPRFVIAHGGPAAKHHGGWIDGQLIACPHLFRAGYVVVGDAIELVVAGRVH